MEDTFENFKKLFNAENTVKCIQQQKFELDRVSELKAKEKKARERLNQAVKLLREDQHSLPTPAENHLEQQKLEVMFRHRKMNSRRVVVALNATTSMYEYVKPNDENSAHIHSYRSHRVIPLNDPSVANDHSTSNVSVSHINNLRSVVKNRNEAVSFLKSSENYKIERTIVPTAISSPARSEPEAVAFFKTDNYKIKRTVVPAAMTLPARSKRLPSVHFLVKY